MNKEIQKGLEKLVIGAIKFPGSKICKHLVALDLLDFMMKNGCEYPNELIKAVVEADDYKALELLSNL